MADLTAKMQKELDGIVAAANEGLPAQLRDFVLIAVNGFRMHVAYYNSHYKRKQLQAHIDTLSHLITLGVHDR
jgi:hypothetical protein